MLSLLLNACIIHGFLPVGLMESVIVPIVKNARENISSKDNYRPIALTSTLSKILEKIILARYSYKPRRISLDLKAIVLLICVFSV